MGLREDVAGALSVWESSGDLTQLRSELERIGASATADAVVMVAEEFRDVPAVIAPLYERVIRDQPENARALVILANAYWLLGSGPEPVAALASRAIAADPGHRGAWHLWALAESDPRQRVSRWSQVAERFPDDLLALANLADNATSIASAEQDYEMLDVAVASYETLLARHPTKEQADAVEVALRAIKGWRF